MTDTRKYYIFRKKCSKWIHRFINTKDALLTAFEDSFTDRNHEGEQYYFFKSVTNKSYKVFVSKKVWTVPATAKRFGLSNQWVLNTVFSHNRLQEVCNDFLENGAEHMHETRRFELWLLLDVI